MTQPLPDKLDDLITMQVGLVRHTNTGPREPANGTPMLPGTAPAGRRPAPILRLHPTRYRYTGNASPSANSEAPLAGNPRTEGVTRRTL